MLEGRFELLKLGGRDIAVSGRDHLACVKNYLRGGDGPT